ncbi:MAG: GvpL/GvpF family gas vesicle protein, partial [Desulfomonile tiedjei]|nr:GvpL/GvpF family gas vesicle protein [Desulfomonile tiedjei]
MKCLMYCIFSSNGPAQMDCKPEGVGGGQVQVIENNGLAAAVSAVSEADISQDPLTVIAYHKIIETFHGQMCVIPLRFGTIVNHESEV